MLEIKTESGRTYHVDVAGGRWNRLPKSPGEYDAGFLSLYELQRGTHFAFPWNSPEGTWEKGLPEVGKFMYISGRDVWWTSTMVVSVEEIEGGI